MNNLVEISGFSDEFWWYHQATELLDDPLEWLLALEQDEIETSLFDS